MDLRNHVPEQVDQFNGLFKRGDADSVPKDHFSECNNLAFVQGGFRSRDGLDIFAAIPNVRRMYNFVQETGESQLVLDDIGNIYDTGSATPLTPILTVTGMTDFAYVSIAGRAYLSPNDGHTGLEDEFTYVYEGDGTPARKAAGFAPTNAEGLLAAANGAAGHVEPGIHIFGAVYETESGFLSSIGPATKAVLLTPGTNKVNLTSIPVSVSAVVTKVHIVSTKAIDPAFYTGDTTQYEFFFIPDAIVNNGITILTVDFFDADLLDSADNLFDLFEEIPAFVGLSTYHGRMMGWGEFDNISVCRVSDIGEPESINEVSGLLEIPLDGKPLTNGQEFRDVWYQYKQIRTFAFSDNGDLPSSWPMTVLDQGIGCSVHGMATVLDSGGVNIDYLIIVDYSGVMLFNGAYIRPELSWKIKDLWFALDRPFFDFIQIVNDSLSQIFYVTLPDRQMLIGDYSNGLDPKNIRWCPWSFDVETTTITLTDTNTLLVGSAGEL